MADEVGAAVGDVDFLRSGHFLRSESTLNVTPPGHPRVDLQPPAEEAGLPILQSHDAFGAT